MHEWGAQILRHCNWKSKTVRAKACMSQLQDYVDNDPQSVEDLMMGYQDVQDAMMAEALSALSGTRLVCSSVRVVIRVSYLAFRNWPYGPWINSV